jgi:hypothetical protein
MAERVVSTVVSGVSLTKTSAIENGISLQDTKKKIIKKRLSSF